MKNSSLLIRTILILAVTLIGIYLVFGPRRAPVANDFTWQGIKNNLAGNINLGLDLKGGSYLVMRVKTDEYLKVLTENNAQAALSAGKDAQLPVGEVSTVAENGTYSITLPVTDTARTQEVIDAVKQKVDFVNWTENASGNAVSWSLPTANQNL
jgi:preprotein translocase subunit SecD